MANLTSGEFKATGQSASVKVVERVRFNVSVWGTFVASVQLERSFDNGATWLKLTSAGQQVYAWTAAASEIALEPEAGALYRLNCTAYTSGTVSYMIGQ